MDSAWTRDLDLDLDLSTIFRMEWKEGEVPWRLAPGFWSMNMFLRRGLGCKSGHRVSLYRVGVGWSWLGELERGRDRDRDGDGVSKHGDAMQKCGEGPYLVKYSGVGTPVLSAKVEKEIWRLYICQHEQVMLCCCCDR